PHGDGPGRAGVGEALRGQGDATRLGEGKDVARPARRPRDRSRAVHTCGRHGGGSVSAATDNWRRPGPRDQSRTLVLRAAAPSPPTAVTSRSCTVPPPALPPRAVPSGPRAATGVGPTAAATPAAAGAGPTAVLAFTASLARLGPLAAACAARRIGNAMGRAIPIHTYVLLRVQPIGL